jgi:predicted DsbA family dithiol-disulfide isomerase
MTKRLKIDFVSDVSCPWCAVGLKSLEQALQRLEGTIGVDLHIQPFELNPQMPPEGQDTVEHLTQKYRISPEEVAQNQEAIRARGAAVGFTFNQRGRVFNTFNAHRLLHWASFEGRQLALKHALLRAYFTDGENPSAHDVLVRLAAEAGLDAQRAKEILDSDTYADETRRQERFYLDAGIHSVPAVIINDRYLVQGGQPAEVFEQALRQAADAA